MDFLVRSENRQGGGSWPLPGKKETAPMTDTAGLTIVRDSVMGAPSHVEGRMLNVVLRRGGDSGLSCVDRTKSQESGLHYGQSVGERGGGGFMAHHKDAKNKTKDKVAGSGCNPCDSLDPWISQPSVGTFFVRWRAWGATKELADG